MKKFILPINIKSVKLFKNFNEAITLFLPTIAIQIYTVLDKTMLGLITKDSFENGYYEQAIKIPKVLLAIVTAVSTIAIPRVSYYFNKKDNDSVNKLMYKSYRFVWFLVIPMSLGLFILSDNFVPWFFGVDFIKVSLLLKLLSFLIIAIGFSNITGRLFMISAKLQNKLTISLSIGATINVLLNMLLIRYYKSIGASIASIIAEVTITIMQLYFVRKYISWKKVLCEGKNYIIAGLIMFFALYAISKCFLPSIINTIIVVTIGFSIYILVLLLLHDAFLLENIKFVLKKVCLCK